MKGAAAATARFRIMSRARGLGIDRFAGVAIGLVAVCAYLAITQSGFLTWSNWQNIFRAQAVVAVLAIGMTFVILSGGVDLSVAALTGAAAMMLGTTVLHGASWGVAVLVGIAAGVVLGFVNGFLIGVVRIPFFVVTLGTLSVYQTVALVTKNGETISLSPFKSFEPVTALVNNHLGPFPIIMIVWCGLYVAAAVVLRHTPFGRAVYAVGSNPDAARLTGINVTLVLVSVYTISGLLAGVGSVVQAGRLAAASPQIDPNLMLTVVAAVLIGGTSLTGGEGGILETFIGVLFLGVIQNGLSLGDLNTFWQGVVSGVVLIVAVGLGVLRQHGWRIRLRPRVALPAPGQPPL